MSEKIKTYLNDRVLILNAGWTPIGVTNVKRAIKDLAKGSAKVIKTDGSWQVFNWDQWITESPVEPGKVIAGHLVNVPVPEVIIAWNYHKVPSKGSVYSKPNLHRRDRHTCQYCGSQIGAMTVDHVKPRAQGGKTSWRNCVSSCGKCNGFKADRTPAEAGMRLRRQPEQPEWSPLSTVKELDRPGSWQPFFKKVT